MNLIRPVITLIKHIWCSIFGDPELVKHERESQDLLASHADRLIGQEKAEEVYAYPNDPEIAALMSLARHTRGYLYPMRPATGFQSRLLHDLMRQAHAQLGHDGHSLWEEKRKEIIIGATITSLISAVGVVAYLMRLTPFNRPPTSTG